MMLDDGQPRRRGCAALLVLLASRCDAKTWCDPAGTIARRNGSIALLRKHSKASSSFALSFVRAHAGKWRRKQDNSKAIVVDSPAAEDKWRRRDDEYADDTFLWPQEANATDARCLPVFEREGVLLATSLRTPYLFGVYEALCSSPIPTVNYYFAPNRYNRTAAAFLASPDPANFTATDNAYVRAFNGRCLGPLSLETCLRGCPGPRGAVTRDDLERAKELIASFDVVFFTEVRWSHSLGTPIVPT